MRVSEQIAWNERLWCTNAWVGTEMKILVYIDTFVISMVSYIIAMENIHHLMMYAKMRYPKSAE